MASTLPATDRSTRLNTLEPRPAKASIDVNRSEKSVETVDGIDPVSLFFESLAACGMSDKEAAYTMAMDPAQLSRVKSRQARLPFDAMWRLPATFWIEFRNRIDEAKALTVDHAREVKAARIGELVKLLVEVA